MLQSVGLQTVRHNLATEQQMQMVVYLLIKMLYCKKHPVTYLRMHMAAGLTKANIRYKLNVHK